MAAPDAGHSAVTVVAAFADEPASVHARAALLAAGIDPAAVTLAGGSAGAPVAASAPQRDAAFIWRLVLIVVAWSIVGTFAGAVIGLALAAAGVPPGGAFGVLIQIVVWALFFHLMAGLWAGYALLTRGESRQPVTRTRSGQVLLRVVTGDAEEPRVRGCLGDAGALRVAAYAADGRLLEAARG